MYKDAIDTAAESEDCDVAEDLLMYFVFDAADKECFTATLYTCYALVKPDVVMELAWRNGLTDYASKLSPSDNCPLPPISPITSTTTNTN